MRHLALLLACVLCIAACSSGPRRALDEAEGLMASRPDSALAILQGIPQESLKTQCLQARWSLLYTAAQDKNSITIQNDAPVQAAYEFYHRHGPQTDRMRAAYYWSIVKQNTGETAEATILFKEAEQLAEKLEDNHFLGLAREHLCALHANNYDSQTALEYASKAVSAFDAAGEKLSADFSRMDVARQSYNLGDRQRAIEIADSLLAYNQDADPGLRYTLLVLRADIHYWDQEFEQARERYEQAMSLGYPLGLLGLGNMAIIKEHAGQHAAADSCLCVISEQMLTPYDSTVYYSCKNKIQLLRGEYKEAYTAAEKAMKLQNNVVRNELSRSLTRTQKAYFEERYASENAHNKILVLGFVLIATLLSIIIWRPISHCSGTKSRRSRKWSGWKACPWSSRFFRSGRKAPARSCRFWSRTRSAPCRILPTPISPGPTKPCLREKSRAGNSRRKISLPSSARNFDPCEKTTSSFPISRKHWT